MTSRTSILIGALAALLLVASVASPAGADDELLPVVVTFRGVGADDPGRAASAHGIGHVGEVFPSIDAVAARVDRRTRARLEHEPGVLRVEEDREVHTATDSARAAIHVPQAASAYAATGDAAGNGMKVYSPGDVVVAVIDTGINAGHLALDEGKLLTRQNFSTCSAIGTDWDDSDNGHGSNVAGIIAGDGDGVTGMAPGAALIDLKALCNNSGRQSDVNAALTWVLTHAGQYGIDVVNMSLSLVSCGGDGTDSTSRLVNQVVASGVTVTAAAGNCGPSGGTITSPGTANYAVTVGAAVEPSPSWSVASFSSRGPTSDGRIKPDIVAPGVNLTSAAGSGPVGTSTLSGTSMASAVAAGVVGMLVEINTDLRPRGTICGGCATGVDDASMIVPALDLLHATSIDLAPAGPDVASGWGVIDAVRLMNGVLPVGNFDGVSAGARPTATVQGWAVDAAPSRAVEVHVYVNGGFAGYGYANLPRPDLAGLFPTSGPNHGFSFDVPVPAGTSSVCAFAIDDGNPDRNRFLGCRTVTRPSGSPFGNVDGITRVPGGVDLSGWTIDPDTAGSIEVDAWSNGRFLGFGQANLYRSDIASAFPAYGGYHGFNVHVPLGPGTATVCAYGINVGAGANAAISCPTITVTSSPFGHLDGASRSGGTIQLSGWAIDPDVAAATEVHVYVDGAFANFGYTYISRPDVYSLFPAYGPNRGWALAASVGAGTHHVCAFAINQGPGVNILLGCADL